MPKPRMKPHARARLRMLRSLMETHGLSRGDVARITSRRASTVRVWLSANQAVSADALRLLHMGLGLGPVDIPGVGE